MASKLQLLRLLYKKPILQQPLNICQQHTSKRFLNDTLKRKYEQFQKDDGVPVYLKGGFTDKALLATSTVLCVIGILDGARCIYILAFPKRN